ncbi:MAG: HAMP domain-containing histidine kinase, partial [Clostridia bacterium]|nr:HAMP domain-containing histidine kinase [Clostridia bacterium]
EKQTIPDYEAALKSDTRTATYTGTNPYGESIASQTFLLPTSNGEETGAVRYIISLQKLEAQQGKLLILIFFIFLILVLIIVISGILFIDSIIKPVNEINKIATRVAEGDLTARAPPQHYEDEISELANNINYMVEEISSSDKMKNDFISTVSHEMKTPLTAIKGWGETLLDVGDADPELTRRGIEVIINESGRLTNVVNDLLDLSRIVNGRLTLRTDRIDALAELDETIFVFKERSMREGIELVYNAPHNPAPMVGDADRLKQVFVNILDNAFKYNEQGGKVTVSAEILPGEENTATLKIVVEDTGCGISEEDLPRVKQKFYKSNISVKGSGIGLAVCDEIVSMHNGTLDIASVLGEGTTVTVTLPIEYAVEEEAENA